jgi:excisionase family DNA binding protein
MDVAEAAHYLKANPNTIRVWVRAGRLRASRSGRKLVFTQEDLEEFLQPATGGALAETSSL